MVSMALPIDAPTPRSRPGGLLIDAVDTLDIAALAHPVPKIDGTSVPPDPEKWRQGIEFVPLGCSGLSRRDVDLCSDPGVALTDEDHPVPFAPNSVEFGPFGIVGMEKCAAGRLTEKWLTDRILARFGAFESEQIAAELLGVDPVAGALSPTLKTSATVLDPGNTGTLYHAIALIEEGLAARLHGAAGIIHVTPAAMLYLQAGGGLIRDAWKWYTPSGHQVVFDAGFDGTVPTPFTYDGDGEVIVDGDGAPVLDEVDETDIDEWAYGSGPVALKLDTPDPVGRGAEVIDRRKNRIEVFRVATGLFVFEPCTVVAAGFAYPTT